MHVTKYSTVALLMASMLGSTSLMASEWGTVAARATADEGYEVRAHQFRVAKVPLDYFAGLQAGASNLTLPLPDGGEVTFALEAYDVLPADLAAKYPQIRTFKGYNPAHPVDTGRFDLGPQGFHAMFSHQGQMVFVDPLRNAEGYAVYYQKDAHSRLEEDADKVIGTGVSKLVRKVQVDGNARKRYTIAISAAGEYTRYHGGSKVLALAAITTLLNRVNEVYQRDVGAEFVLASGNDSVIFSDPASDPFDNTDADADRNVDVQAQAFADGDLGAFDIGHVLNTGGGGLAGLGVLCVDAMPPYYAYGAKSSGMTGSSDPVGDAFLSIMWPMRLATSSVPITPLTVQRAVVVGATGPPGRCSSRAVAAPSWPMPASAVRRISSRTAIPIFIANPSSGCVRTWLPYRLAEPHSR